MPALTHDNGVVCGRSESVTIVGYKEGVESLNITINANCKGRYMKQSFKSKQWDSSISNYASRQRNIKTHYVVNISNC